MAEYVIHLDGDRGTLLVDGQQPELFGALVGVTVRRDLLDVPPLAPLVVRARQLPVVEVTLRLPLGATDHLTVVQGSRIGDAYGPTADGEAGL